MSSKDILQSLYESGMPAHDLRRFYVDDSVGISLWSEAAGAHIPKPNPYLDNSRKQLILAQKNTPPDYEDNRIEIEIALGALEDAEQRASVDLASGRFITLGYPENSPETLVVIHASQWNWLNLDFDIGLACNKTGQGNPLVYAGIKFIRQDALSDKDKNLIEEAISPPQSTSPHEKSRTITPFSFEAIGAIKWSEVTIRLLKNNFAEVCGPNKSRKVSLNDLGLMNKTEQKPNKAFDDLLKISKGPYITPHRKLAISKLRKTLQKCLCTDENPVPLQGRAYSLAFTLVDDRKAADERAKSDAKHVPYDDNVRHESAAGPEETYTFYDEPEEADDKDKASQKWLEKHGFQSTRRS
jgi:hypothetical protein